LNGPWGSKIHPNLHALKVFRARVPARNIAQISKVSLIIHIKAWERDWVFRNSQDAAHLHTVCRALVKQLTGIRFVSLEVCTRGFPGSYPPNPIVGKPPFLSYSEVQSEIAKTVVLLSKLERLEKVEVCDPDQLTWDTFFR